MHVAWKTLFLVSPLQLLLTPLPPLSRDGRSYSADASWLAFPFSPFPPQTPLASVFCSTPRAICLCIYVSLALCCKKMPAYRWQGSGAAHRRPPVQI